MGYSTRAERRAIIKMVNYKYSGFDKLDGRIEYLLDHKKTAPKWQKGNHIQTGNAMHDFQVIYERHQPKGTRFFRQGILSFGVKNLDVNTAFKAGCEVFAHEYKSYPYLICIHTNLTHHIHVHFLHFTVNLKDGTKWEQAPFEFNAFRDNVDAVLAKYRLPLLKRKEKPAHNCIINDPSEEVGEPYQGPYNHLNLVPFFSGYPVIEPPSKSFYTQGNCRLDLPQLQYDITTGLENIKKLVNGGK